MNRAMHINHGMAVRGATHAVNFEARGKSQLMKELNECGAWNAPASVVVDGKRIINKIVFVKDAIHKNEMTNEVEPDDPVNEIFDIHVSGNR